MDRERVDRAIEIFRSNPRDPRLLNHPLEHGLKGKRSISAGYDLRIVFTVEGNYVSVILLDVGSHSRVY